MKKIISVLLAISFVFSICSVAAVAADGTKTHCGGEGNCNTVPSIVIHGIGQSNVYLTDGNGNRVLDKDGKEITCFPMYADVGAIVRTVLFPVLFTLLFQKNMGLSKALKKVVYQLFYMNICDSQGKDSKYCELEEYPKSVAACTPEEKATIYRNIPLEKYGEIAGEDHLYYFAYNSFGNNLDIVDRLYRYIEMVKEETGHDKVNIVPISLGGAISNGLLEYYNGTYEGRPDVYPSINKVVYIVPALDGSSIIGDVFNLDLTFLNLDYLYNGFLEGLMDENTARWIEVALRILPDDVIEEVLNDTCYNLVNDVIRYCTNMWALCPSADYPGAAEKWLSDPEMAEIKRQTDMFYKAQLNSDANIKRLAEFGIKAFNIVDYDFPIYNVGNSWNKENADGVIDLDSTSMGAISANCGETLPEGYQQANTYCSNPEHNHISPDRVVDASTGLLPDTTFYFDNQGHESTARNDIILTLATNILAYDDIENVYSDPNFPQFNQARDTRGLKNLLKEAKEADKSGLTAEQAQELEKAIADTEALLASTVEKEGETKKVEKELKDALVNAGLRKADKDKEKEAGLSKKLSLGMLDKFGTNGLSEYPIVLVTKLFSLIKGQPKADKAA